MISEILVVDLAYAKPLQIFRTLIDGTGTVVKEVRLICEELFRELKIRVILD